MNSYFSPEFFRGNRDRLRHLFTGTAPIVISANGLLQRNADSNYAFRQDSTFWYLTGITEPDFVLVMDKGKEYIIMPGRDERRQAFDGKLETLGFSESSGISEFYDEKDGWKLLRSRLSKVRHVATLAAPPAYIEAYGLYTNPSRASLVKKCKEANPDIEVLDLRPQVTAMRSTKQTSELEAIREAIDITTSTLKKLQKKGFEKFEYEYQVEAEITAGFRREGAAHAYMPIVASEINACTLHYSSNNSLLVRGGLLLLDVGAEVLNYAADITRTYAVGDTSKRQQKIWESVVDVQEYAKNLLRPGVNLREYEQRVEHYMGEKLRELGLIKSIEHEAVRRYFPHATSHFLGLDVHDIGDYDKPLQAGMVLTCEPGIYIAEEKIGIRIEDDILITEDGHEVLSSRLPRELF